MNISEICKLQFIFFVVKTKTHKTNVKIFVFLIKDYKDEKVLYDRDTFI
jgi:hypothetical protein